MSAPRGVRLPEPIRFRGVIPATGWSAAFGEVDPDGAVEVWFVPVIFWAIRAGSDAGPGIDDDAVVAIIRDEDAPGGLAAIVDDRTTGLSFLGLVTEAERREDEDGVLEHFKDLVRWRHERAEAIRARDAERAEVERGRGLIMLEGWPRARRDRGAAMSTAPAVMPFGKHKGTRRGGEAMTAKRQRYPLPGPRSFLTIRGRLMTFQFGDLVEDPAHPYTGRWTPGGLNAAGDERMREWVERLFHDAELGRRRCS